MDAGANLQTLLVAAISTVLVTRLYLSLTGYPRIGTGPLHIAHLLWGGLLMLVALTLVIGFLGKRAKRLAAIAGGIGFGLFIDEIGKFVTSDNNYFFQPAIALIYIAFVLLFLLFRAIERRSLSPREFLVNAADMLREIVLSGATRHAVARARLLLVHSGFSGPLGVALREAIDSATRAPERKSPVAALSNYSWRAYDHLLEWPWFQRALLVVFVVQAVAEVIETLVLGGNATLLWPSVAGLGLALIGVAQLPRSRLEAYRWFERSVLISIFFTQVVLFWQDQLAALGGLFWNLALLRALRFFIHEEGVRNVTEH